jgi:hypothetical protein
MWLMAREAALAEGERLVLHLHPRWKVLLRPVLILAVIVAATLALLIVVTPRQHSAPLRPGVGVVALPAVLFWCAGPVLRWWSTS